FQPGNRPSCSSVSAVSRANRSLRSFSAIAGGTPLAFPSSRSCLSPLWRKRTSRMASLQIPSMYGYTVHVKPFGCRGTIPPPDSSRRALPEKVVGGGRAAQGKFGVRANADIPRDAKVARKFGAEGIGLCRTEHMFFAEDRIEHMQAMIL